MVVRHDKAGLIDNKAGAEVPHSLAAIGQILTAEKVKEIEWIKLPGIPIAVIRVVGVVGIVRIVVAIATANGIFRRGLGIDIDHGRPDIRRYLSKRVGK